MSNKFPPPQKKDEILKIYSGSTELFTSHLFHCSLARSHTHTHTRTEKKKGGRGGGKKNSQGIAVAEILCAFFFCDEGIIYIYQLT